MVNILHFHCCSLGSIPGQPCLGNCQGVCCGQNEKKILNEETEAQRGKITHNIPLSHFSQTESLNIHILKSRYILILQSCRNGLKQGEVTGPAAELKCQPSCRHLFCVSGLESQEVNSS